jgi:hypothetical protein
MREMLLDWCEKQSPPGSAQQLKLAKGQVSSARQVALALALWPIQTIKSCIQLMFPSPLPSHNDPVGRALYVEISRKTPNAPWLWAWCCNVKCDL